MQHLKKLVALRNLEPTGTEDLFNLVALLVDDILEPTPEQFAEIMALRVGSCSPESEEVTVECLEPCMNPQDQKDAKEDSQKCAAEKKEQTDWQQKHTDWMVRKGHWDCKHGKQNPLQGQVEVLPLPRRR